MSGLEALSVACSIFQVISFGMEAARVAKRIYRDGSVDLDVGRNATDLESVMCRMTSRSDALPKSRHHHQLLQICATCQETAKELKDELSRISATSNPGSLVSALKTTAKALYHSRRLTKIEAKLGGLEKLLHTTFLERIFLSTNTMGQDLDTLDSDVRFFIQQYRQGHRKVTELVSNEALLTRQEVTREGEETREHVTKEMNQNQAAIAENMVALKSAHELGKHAEQFLRCFKFDGSNQRRNEVHPSYTKTFQWIFKDRQESDSSDGEETDSSGSDDEDTVLEIVWDNFSGWLQSQETGKPYWISGKPGSGKSTLMKYIIGHEKTPQFLEKWRQDTVIVSHFIWKLGARRLQKNLRGVLCSLIYQLLEGNPTMLATFATTPAWRNKNSESDWSTQELKAMLVRITHEYDRPICGFVDGLDELETPDDISQLFGVVDKMIASGNAKLCLASRAELVFRARFAQTPHLRLQDLTFKDISRYIHGNIVFASSDFTDQQRQAIVKLIVSKAEGVFIWAYLVVSNLKRGLDFGDDYDILMRRIESLPRDLADLYRDMWGRMNGHDTVYQNDAATYLKLALAWQTVSSCGMKWPLTPLLMVFATDPDLCRDILHREELSTPTGALTRRCEKLLKVVGTRCAGLLEPNAAGIADSMYLVSSSEYKDLVAYSDGKAAVFRFIHRTASDFLRDTEDGQNILVKETASEAEMALRLIDACYAHVQLFRCSSISYVGRWFRVISQLQKGTDLFKSTQPNENLIRRLDMCKALCGRRRMLDDWAKKYWYYCGQNRLYTLAARCCLNEWISEELKKESLSSKLKSRMILNAGTFYGDFERDLELFSRLLLEGADAHCDEFWEEAEVLRQLPLEDDGGGRLALRRTPLAKMLGEIIAHIPIDASCILPVLRLFNQLIQDTVDLKTLVCINMVPGKFNFATPEYPSNKYWCGRGLRIFAKADGLIGTIVGGLHKQVHRDSQLQSEEMQHLMTILQSKLLSSERPIEKLLAIREPPVSDAGNNKTIDPHIRGGGATNNEPRTLASWIEGEWHENIAGLICKFIGNGGADAEEVCGNLAVGLDEYWAQVSDPMPFWRHYPNSGYIRPMTMLRDHGRQEVLVTVDEVLGPLVGYFDGDGNWISVDTATPDAVEQPPSI